MARASQDHWLLFDAALNNEFVDFFSGFKTIHKRHITVHKYKFVASLWTKTPFRIFNNIHPYLFKRFNAVKDLVANIIGIQPHFVFENDDEGMMIENLVIDNEYLLLIGWNILLLHYTSHTINSIIFVFNIKV